MSFQDSVIKEIADMTTTTSPLWKFEIVYPLSYRADCNEDYEFTNRVVQTTIILDYETFKKGHRRTPVSCPEQDWKELTDSRQDTFNSRLFDSIEKHIQEASRREGINLEDSYVSILSRTLLN